MKAYLGRVSIGDDEPVRLMGVINASPESFYKGSIRTNVDDALKAVSEMLECGVDIIDVGGMSTAPYKRTHIGVEEELRRVLPIVKAIKSEYPYVTVSVDTFRAKVAEECLKVGAEVVNDVTGLKGDPDMAKVIAEYKASAVIMAREVEPKVDRRPLERVIAALRESLSIARERGIEEERIVVDPGIGFPPLSLDPAYKGGEPITGEYRHGDGVYPWYVWDSVMTLNIWRIKQEVKRPVLIGISRKSFLERLMRRKAPPEERLYASIAVEAIAVLMGANAIRTHNVCESRDAVRAAEALRKCLGKDEYSCREELIRLISR